MFNTIFDVTVIGRLKLFKGIGGARKVFLNILNQQCSLMFFPGRGSWPFTSLTWVLKTSLGVVPKYLDSKIELEL